MDCLAHLTQILNLLKITKFTLINNSLNLLSKLHNTKCPLWQSKLILLIETLLPKKLQWAKCYLLNLPRTVIQNKQLEPIVNCHQLIFTLCKLYVAVIYDK